jgi:hypothetical protein
MSEDLENFNHYEFICINCGSNQFVSYAKDLVDPDRHCCFACQTVFWWSPVQKKLYLEDTKMEVPNSYMKTL